MLVQSTSAKASPTEDWGNVIIGNNGDACFVITMVITVINNVFGLTWCIRFIFLSRMHSEIIKRKTWLQRDIRLRNICQYYLHQGYSAVVFVHRKSVPYCEIQWYYFVGIDHHMPLSMVVIEEVVLKIQIQMSSYKSFRENLSIYNHRWVLSWRIPRGFVCHTHHAKSWLSCTREDYYHILLISVYVY